MRKRKGERKRIYNKKKRKKRKERRKNYKRRKPSTVPRRGEVINNNINDKK